MFLEPNSIAAETRAVEYLQDNYRSIFKAERAVEKAQPERRTFELPKSIWHVMFLCYAVFFLAITLALGGEGSALFMILISVGYTVMYFGTATVMNSVGSKGRPATIPGDVDTLTGKLGYWAAFAQILTVPLMVAFFGCAVGIMCTLAIR
jgi:hypothetical protein